MIKHNNINDTANAVSQKLSIEPNFQNKNKLITDILIASGFYADALDGDLQKYDSDVQEKIKNYIINADKYIVKGRGLYISGKLGTGKTTLATVIAKEIFIKFLKKSIELSIRFTTIAKLMEIVKSKTYNIEKNNEYYNLINADLLVLDNLGNEYTKNNENMLVNSLLDDFLKERHGKRHTTIITSNVSKDKLGEFYCEVVQDVILAQCYTVELNNFSLRKLNELGKL